MIICSVLFTELTLSITITPSVVLLTLFLSHGILILLCCLCKLEPFCQAFQFTRCVYLVQLLMYLLPNHNLLYLCYFKLLSVIWLSQLNFLKSRIAVIDYLFSAYCVAVTTLIVSHAHISLHPFNREVIIIFILEVKELKYGGVK